MPDKTELKKELRKENNPRVEAEVEVLIEKYGNHASLALLIQIRDELRKSKP